MYIRQLFAVAALLLIGTNSMPQPQDDTTPTTTTAAGMTGPPTGSFSGHMKDGKEEYVSWKNFIGGYPDKHFAPPGVGNGGSGETTTTTGGGTFSTTVPPSNSTDTTDTTDTTDDTTDTTTSATTATATAVSDTSDKLRRAIAF